jgi:very-short-patch-repair endonuclease
MEKLDPVEFARHQRQCANSYEELMWQVLRNRQRCKMKFRRQQPLGPFTADFYSPEAKLVIEIDGLPHLTDEGKRYDAARDYWMNQQGIKVLRFTRKQVDFELASVCESIDTTLREIISKND